MNVILDILFPKKCVGCKKEGAYFCPSCISNILQTDLVCPRCEKVAIGGQTHPICKRKYGLNGLWSLGIYQGPLQKAIKQLKYGRVKDLAEILVDILIKYWVKFQPFILDEIKKDQAMGWVIIPVPLYWWRENDRGYNQSCLIGKILSKKLGLDYSECLKRIRYTQPQVTLKGQQRKQNIFNAFAMSPNIPISKFPNILLIDDVWTTGSTMKECTYILKRSGAKKVWGITLAR